MLSPRSRLYGLLCGSLIAAALSIARPGCATTVAPMTMEETVYHAAAIFVGQVQEHRSRWRDASHRSMVTDYTVNVEEVILPIPEVRPRRAVSLPFWGGTIGRESQGIAGVSMPIDGQRYLFMLRTERYLFMLRTDWKTPAATPAVGVYHGLLRVLPRGPEGKPVVTEYQGEPLWITTTGRVLRRREITEPARARPGVTLESFARWLRSNLRRIKATPPRPKAQLDPNDPRVLRTVAKQPAPEGQAPRPLSPQEIDLPRSPEELGISVSVPVMPEHPIEREMDALPSAGLSPNLLSIPPFDDGAPRIRYNTFARCDLPIVINQLPASFAPWSPEDQYQMSKWNYYGNIFRIRENPTNSYRWGDGVFDMAGWMNSDTLNAMYQKKWEENTLATTFTRTQGGKIVEADVVFNDKYSWTLQDEWVYDGTSAIPFRQTLLHELGHVWGLDHQFGFLSIMNYPGSNYRGFSFPYMDDAQGSATPIRPRRRREMTSPSICIVASAEERPTRTGSKPTSRAAWRRASRFQSRISTWRMLERSRSGRRRSSGTWPRPATTINHTTTWGRPPSRR